MKLVSFLLGAALLVAPAAAFDNSTCKDFMVGTWSGKQTIKPKGTPIKIKFKGTYNADGTFEANISMEIPNAPAQPRAVEGTWSAEPGPGADKCNTTVTTETDGVQNDTITVVDDNNVVSAAGMKLERETD